jgi:chemotaxis signal transduction protein
MQEFGELGAEINPVMSFEADGARLAVRIDQVDGVVLASPLAPVPLTRPEHLGVFARGDELVPVLSLEPRPARAEQMVAVLQVRGEPVGLAIDRPGRVHQHYRADEGPAAPPALARANAVHARGGGESFWLVDPDRLWLND